MQYELEQRKILVYSAPTCVSLQDSETRTENSGDFLQITCNCQHQLS
jgi:hypothetical protein